MAFCTTCGAQVDASARFCPSCGAVNSVGEPTGSPAPGAAAPPPSATFNAAPPAPGAVPGAAPGAVPGAAPAPNQVNTPLGNIDFSFNAPTAGVADPQDVAANKGMAILSYILFFVPLIAGAHKTSPFVRFHANQGTVLFIAALIYSVALAIILSVLLFIIPWPLLSVYSLVSNLLHLVPLALMIIGVINAANGTLKQLPVIGGLSIIK